MQKQSERSFHNLIKSELALFLEHNRLIYPEKDTFKIDLHCHDLNSNVPDELLGRILNVSETWLPTSNLIGTLTKQGMEAFTITNHNNARSCFEMLDKGFDILVGAEFSCMVPDYQVGIHVLTYGFTPEQETILNKLRKNLYSFLDYTIANNLPTIWAHPLYHYKKSETIPPDFFNKMALVFERFEVLNGQRDTWQNMLVKRWIEGLSRDKLDELSEKSGIEPGRFCRDPYRKSMSGGSDSHIGIFSGLTGTRLYIKDIDEKKKNKPLSELALEALRQGNMAAFGGHNNSEKMMITFLDYFCQIAIHGDDPGLLRILLHNGETHDKISALLVANGFAELRRHKVTMKFINLFHNSLTGIEPHFTKRWLIPNEYKPIFDQAKIMALTFQSNPVLAVETYSNSVYQIFNMLGKILNDRLSVKLNDLKPYRKSEVPDLNKIISRIELPSEFRMYLGTGTGQSRSEKSSKHSPDLISFLDGLSFPFLSSAIILSAHFVSARVLFNNRPLLNDFSKSLKSLEHPKRLLWLSDTWGDNNGVSMVLKSFLEEIRNRNLPIDIMVCSSTLKNEDHLVVINPQSEILIKFYKDQKYRVPNFLDIHHKFLNGEYDRIMCSTEGPMGLAALYLKHAYSVPAYFYMHTDWIFYSRKVLKIEKENQSRFRRILRAYYKAFDGLFVFNSDHLNWLTNKKMGLNKLSVFLTSHWPGSHFFPRPPAKKQLFKIKKNQPVILFAGRISYEKGVMDLPEMFKTIRSHIPEIQMVIAGSGPDEEKLKKVFPEAVYVGWVDSLDLPAIYSSSDILILPSKYDTFSCVVLESLSCGLPVIGYNTKGLKDIVSHNENGFLVSNTAEMIQYTVNYFNDSDLQNRIKKAALEISKTHNADQIVQKLLQNTGLAD